MFIKINNKKIPVFEAKNFKTRLFGLMGKKDIQEGILFPKCNAIHTFFMQEEIDVIGLNEENQVVYIYRNVPKNRIVKIQNKNKKTSILELPKDTSKGLVIGSILTFKE